MTHDCTRWGAPDDDRELPVAACHHQPDYAAWVLYDVDGGHHPWILTWTYYAVSDWVERYEQPWHAYARLAALIAACDQQVFLVHRAEHPTDRVALVQEVERFVARTVHASSCRPGCDGRDPVNHPGWDDPSGGIPAPDDLNTRGT